MNTKISAVIITFNEEDKIITCLESIKTIADEILIVDSFSTDSTKDICVNFGAKFIPHTWEGFSKTKNFGIDQAEYNYILSLDADEQLEKELIQSIQRAKESGLTGAYCFNRKNFFLTKWLKYGGLYPDTKTRIFAKNDASWHGEYVHESLQVQKGIKLIKLQGNILHYSFENDEEHWNTIHKYAKLAAKKLLDKNKSFSNSKSWIQSIAVFVKIYFIKFGLLDGVSGLKYAYRSAYSKRLRWKYYKENRN